MRHSHRCDACGTVWTHEQRNDVSEAVYNSLHDCPTCGRNQRIVHSYVNSAWDSRGLSPQQLAQLNDSQQPFAGLADLIDRLFRD